MSGFIHSMTEESFISLLLEMLGPILQTRLSHLADKLGQFYSGVRGAFQLANNQRLIQLVKECLEAQLDDSHVTWNVVQVMKDPNFNSSSSLTEGLWGSFKQKISTQLAHLLLTSDVWRVSDHVTMSLWCDFVDANYPQRLMPVNSNNSIIQKPDGFDFCRQPFGRLLASCQQDPNENEPLRWLLNSIATSTDDDGTNLKENYFKDWFLLHTPPHLHPCLKLLPLEKMEEIIDPLFEDQEAFFEDWKFQEAQVVASLELMNITNFATSDEHSWDSGFRKIRSWKAFAESTARFAVTLLAEPAVVQNQQKWIQCISSIERSAGLCDLLDHVEDVSQLWLGLRITKRMLLFDPHCNVQLPELVGSSVEHLIENLTKLVIDSVIRPRLDSRDIRPIDLYALLNHATASNSPEDLSRTLRTCPTTNFLVPFDTDRVVQEEEQCPYCEHLLISRASVDVDFIHHLTQPDATAVESLFRDHLKFLFVFERVVELFVHHRKDHPQDVREFFHHLLTDTTHLRVSWRFLTVILKSVLSTQSGRAIVDSLLSTIRCNAFNKDELNLNTQNFLRALLIRADEDVIGEDISVETMFWTEAIMMDEWTVERVHQLALVRKALSSGRVDVAADALNQWILLLRNEHDPGATEAFLFFILNFSSGQGDEARLKTLFQHLRANQELNRHPIVGPLIRYNLLSPLSVGFNLLPPGMRTRRFEDGHIPLDNMLQELEPDFAACIARLAFHATDVAENKDISLLSELARNNVDLIVQCYLPGMEDHCEIACWRSDSQIRVLPPLWWVCTCGMNNRVLNCGLPMPYTLCSRCRTPLAHTDHKPRRGVRQASLGDFSPPRGIAMPRIPSAAPGFTVRKKNASVTRFCLLLNCLALMNAALDHPQMSNQVAAQLLRTLTDHHEQQQLDRRSFIRILSEQILVHLKFLTQLLVANRPQLTQSDQFRIAHLLLHKLLNFQDAALTVNAQQFSASPLPREAFGNALGQLLATQAHLELELDRIAEESDEVARMFKRSLTISQSSIWAYGCITSSNRVTVQLFLARDASLIQRFPFLHLLLDDENWANKLDALQHLGDAVRFVALARTVLQRKVTLNEVTRMSIAQGLEKISEEVERKAVLLDRGRAVSTPDHVHQLFYAFKGLWDRFSQIPNMERKTFLEYFECGQLDENIRPNPVLDENEAPLILILAGTNSIETGFSVQLLSHAVAEASFIAQMPFVQPGCRSGSDGLIKFGNTADLAQFDDSLFAHVSIQEVDQFISDHVIDKDTLELAESFAMAAVLGLAGSTISSKLVLQSVNEFIFKDNPESENYLSSLEQRFLAWQPSNISPEIQEHIIGDLEKNRILDEARDVLISAIIHLMSNNTESLVISRLRHSFISDTLDAMIKVGILTERHLSTTTMSILSSRHIKLQVRQAFGLLKGIISRMQGDNIFGGRIPAGWDTILDAHTADTTREKLRSHGAHDIIDVLLQMVNTVSSSDEQVPECLSPEKSLLLTIRLYLLEPDWNGIQPELKMEHLGHVLVLAETLMEG